MLNQKSGKTTKIAFATRKFTVANSASKKGEADFPWEHPGTTAGQLSGWWKKCQCIKKKRREKTATRRQIKTLNAVSFVKNVNEPESALFRKPSWPIDGSSFGDCGVGLISSPGF